MLSSIFNNSGVTAKIKVMLGQMLVPEDYEELVRKKTVQEVAAYLKYNTSYKSILEEINENSIHRGQLERVLKKTLIQSYIKLFKFLKGDIKSFLKSIFLRYEIEELKMLTRVLDTGRSPQIAQDSLVFLEKYNTIDIHALAASKNIQQFIENLEGSVYYKLLSPFITNTEHLNLFSIEMVLDMYYFNLLWKQKDKIMSGQDQSIITTSLGSETDILNILWIHRCKKYYNIQNELIYSYIIPHNYKLKKSQIIEMVEAETPEEVESIIKNTPYSKFFSSDKDLLLEHDFDYYIYKLYRSLLRRNNFSIASLMAFIHLKEIEIKNIISVIEGIRYNIEPEQIKKYILVGH